VSTRSHEEYKENIGSYVLGALPDLESELLERHLAGCDSCRAELEELRPVTAALARSVPQVEAPSSLKASLMATVNSEAEMRADKPVRVPRERRNWFASLQPRFAMAMALCVLALGVVIGVAADRSSDHGERTIAAKINRTLMPSGDAKLRVSGNRENVSLRLNNAPEPGSGHLYELWVRRDGRIVPGPVVRSGGDGNIKIPGGVHGADAVMVTLEKKRVTAPTGPVVMTFNI
jgi:anti-sigma-K factor RskA